MSQLPPNEQPFTSRPVEILENPYANANRDFHAQMRLFDEDLIKKYNRAGFTLHILSDRIGICANHGRQRKRNFAKP